MNRRSVRKFKAFWAWQDEKEEAWLRSMSQQGLHLTEPLAPIVYSFLEGEPRDLVYRLDYVQRMSGDERGRYLQLFQDAGWEHLGANGGWQYFRKPVEAGDAPEIFTDPESKVEKYKGLLAYMFIFLPFFVIVVSRIGSRPPAYRALDGVIFVLFLLYVYAFLRIAHRVRQLRRP